MVCSAPKEKRLLVLAKPATRADACYPFPANVAGRHALHAATEPRSVVVDAPPEKPKTAYARPVDKLVIVNHEQTKPTWTRRRRTSSKLSCAGELVNFTHLLQAAGSWDHRR